jgi:hypothetical protein
MALFTGGHAAERGATLVDLHRARQKAEQQKELVATLCGLVRFDEALCRASLDSTEWDLAAARSLLLAFDAHEHQGDRQSESDSESDSRARKRRRKEKKRRQKEKEEPSPKGAAEERIGRHGVLRPEDLYAKEAEFGAWLVEVKQKSPDTLASWEEKELKREFALEWSAGLLQPKYFNLAAWLAKEAQKGGPADASGGEHDFAHLEEDRRRELESDRQASSDKQKAALLEHMRVLGKLDGLREQQALQKQLQLAAQLGDSEKVRELQKQLQPDDPRKGAAAQNYGFRPT